MKAFWKQLRFVWFLQDAEIDHPANDPCPWCLLQCSLAWPGWSGGRWLSQLPVDHFFFCFWPTPHDLWDFSSLIGDWTWALGSESLGLTGLPGNTIFKNTGFKKLYILYGGIADKQYCGSFRWTVKRLSHTYPSLLIHSFSETFAHLPQLFCWWEEKWFMVTAILPDDFRSGTDMPVKNV